MVLGLVPSESNACDFAVFCCPCASEFATLEVLANKFAGGGGGGGGSDGAGAWCAWGTS